MAAVFLPNQLAHLVPEVGRLHAPVLRGLTGARNIDHDARQLVLGIKCKHEVQKMIRTCFVVAEFRLECTAVHHSVAVGCHAEGICLATVVQIHRATGMRHHSVAVTVGHAALASGVPSLADGIGCQVSKDLQILQTRIDLHPVGRLFGGLVQGHGGMGVGGVHYDAVAGNVGILFSYSILHLVDIHMVQRTNIHTDKENGIAAFASIHTKHGDTQRIVDALRRTDITLSGNHNGKLRGILTHCPTKFHSVHSGFLSGLTL